MATAQNMNRERSVKYCVRWGLACLLAPAILAGCSSTYDCQGAQPYMYAEQYPALENPPGLDVPAPDPAMAVPDVADGPVGRYSNPPRPTTGTPFAYCLISPPPMPPSGV